MDINEMKFDKGGFRMKIKNLRESKKLTQEELASKMNVERSTIAMWETGKAVPRTERLPQLAEVLGCSVDDLFKR